MHYKKKIILFLFSFISFFTAYSKSTFGSVQEWGHTNDVSKAISCKTFNHSNVKMKALGYLLYLTVDATKAERKVGGQINNALDYFSKNKSEFKIAKLPNLDCFSTPGGPSHGYYTHLGWNHVYPLQNNVDHNQVWIERKKFFVNTVFKNFDFKSKEQADSFAALIYYIHILGDHEWDEESTNVTRIPVNRLVEEDGYSSEQVSGWKADTTIVDELLRVLPIIFLKQRNSIEYKQIQNMLHRMKTNTSAPQNERAKVILNSLFLYLPKIIEKEGFATNFLK